MTDNWKRQIKVLVPTKEEIDEMAEVGITADIVENELTRAFIEELHRRIEWIMGGGEIKIKEINFEGK